MKSMRRPIARSSKATSGVSRSSPSAFALAAGQITVTASSSSSADERPVNTINGSGLDAGDRHSTDNAKMWLSGPGPKTRPGFGTSSTRCIRFTRCWCGTTTAWPSLSIGFGRQAGDRRVLARRYCLDARWATVMTFARAPGKADYAANTTIDFGGVAAQFVRITITANWGGLLKQYGLSESSLPRTFRSGAPGPQSGRRRHGACSRASLELAAREAGGLARGVPEHRRARGDRRRPLRSSTT